MFGVVGGHQLQRALAEVRGRARIAVANRLRGLPQSADRFPVSGLGAACQLRGHLGRGRAHSQHDRRRLALHRAAQRLRQGLSGGLAQQVVPEPQLLTVFDEQIRAHRLPDRRHQRRRLAFQHRGQQTSREPVRQHRSHPHHLASTAGESRSSRCCIPAPRRRGSAVSAGHRTAAADIEPALLAQTPDQLPDQERISVRLGGQIQQRLIRVRAHGVVDHVGDRARRHRGHPHELRHSRVAAPTRSPAPPARRPRCGRSAPTAPAHPAARWPATAAPTTCRYRPSGCPPSTIASGVSAAAAWIASARSCTTQ